MSLMRTLGLSLLVLGLSGCPFLFSFDRANDLEPGDIRGVAVNADTGEPIPFARISYADGQRRARADTDGAFVIRGLSEGTWVLRLTQDDVAPFGEPERLAVRQAVIRTVPHGLFGGEQKEFVDLGRIDLGGPGSVSGRVIEERVADEAPVPADGATAIAFRRMLASVDAFGNEVSTSTQVTSTEALTITGADGAFSLSNLAPTVAGESELTVFATFDPSDAGEARQCFVSDPITSAVLSNEDVEVGDLELKPAAAFDGNLRVRFDPPQPNADVEVTILAAGTPPGLTEGPGCTSRSVTSDSDSFVELGDLSQLTYDASSQDCAADALRACDLIDVYVRIQQGDVTLRGALFGVVVGQSAGTVELSPVSVAQSPCFPSPGGTDDEIENDCDEDLIFRFPDEALTGQTFFNVVEYCNGVCTDLQANGQTGQTEFVCDLQGEAGADFDLPACPMPNDNAAPCRAEYDCDDDDDGEIDFTEPWCAGLPSGQISELCENDLPETDAGVPDPDAGVDAGVDAGPRPIPTLPDVPVGAATAMSAGGAGTCAIGDDGQAWCWGQHDVLGLDEGVGSRRHALPVPLNGSVVDLDVGTTHACALTDDTTSPVVCWGSNNAGQVGLPFDPNVPLIGQAAALEAGLLVEPAGVVAIAAGRRHTCAILGDDDDRQVVCWGDNSDSQLGTAAVGPVDAAAAVGLDEPAGAEGVWADVAAGNDFTLALTDDGRVYCWGDNDDGRCGQGTTTPNVIATPTEVVIDADGPWVQITAGERHACARNLYGDVACWGDNASDQLGRGGDPLLPGLTPTVAASVQAGGDHTCILTDGGEALLCWGDNTDGQLGDGTSGNTSAPPVTTLSGDAPLYAIGAGSRHTCALTADETGGEHAPCWGDNLNDQLGHGDSSLTPAASGLPRKTHVWLGTVNGQWDDAGNWSNAMVPGPADAAVLDGRGGNTAGNLPTSLTVGTLIVRDAYNGTFSPPSGSDLTVNGSLIIEGGKLQMTDVDGPTTLTVAPITGGNLEILGTATATTLISDGASVVKLEGNTAALDLTTPRPVGQTTSRTELALPVDGTGTITLRGTAGYDDVIVFTEETFNTDDITFEGDAVELRSDVGGMPTGWLVDGNFTFGATSGAWTVSPGIDITVSNGEVTIGDLMFEGTLNTNAASLVRVVGLFVVDPMASVFFGASEVEIASTGALHLFPQSVIYNNAFLLDSGAELGLASGARVNDVIVDATTGPATIVSIGAHPLSISSSIGGLSVSAGSELALEGQLQVDLAGGYVVSGSTLIINAHPSSFVEVVGSLTVGAGGTVNVDGLLVTGSVGVNGDVAGAATLRARDGGRVEVSGSFDATFAGNVITDAGGTIAFTTFGPQDANITNNGDLEVGNLLGVDATNVINGGGTYTLAAENTSLNFDGANLSPTLRIPPGADYLFNDIDVNVAIGQNPGLLIEEGARLVLNGFGDNFLQLHTATVYGALELLGADYLIDDGAGTGQLTLGPVGGAAAVDGTLRAGNGTLTINGAATIAGDARFDGRDNFLDVNVNGEGFTVADGGEVQSFDANIQVGSGGQLPGQGDSLVHVQPGGSMTVNGTFFGEGSDGQLSVFGLVRVGGELSLPTVASLNARGATCQIDSGLLEIGLDAECGTFDQQGGTVMAPRRQLRIIDRFEVTGGTFVHRRGEVHVEVPSDGATLDLPAAPQLYALTVEDFAVSSVVVTNGSRLNVEGPLKLLGTSDGATPFDTADSTGFWEINASGPRLVQEAFIRHSHNVHSTNMRVDPVTVLVDADSAANGWGATCGNGVLELPEQCDDGNAVDTDFCRSTCALNTAFSGGNVCTWVGGGEPVNWGGTGFWTGGTGGICGEVGPGPSDVAIFDANTTGAADLFFGAVSVDTLIIRGDVPNTGVGAAVTLNSGATLTVNHLVIEGCPDGCTLFHGIRINSGGRLIVNETASLGGGVNISGGRLEVRGHSDLSSAVFSSSLGTVELVGSDTATTWDGRASLHGHAPTLQGGLAFLSEGDAAAELTLDGVFDRFQQVTVRNDGEVTDLQQPLTVRTLTGAMLETNNLNLLVNAPGITATFDPGIGFDTTGLNTNLDTATIPVTLGGRLRFDGFDYLYSFPHVGELVIRENAGIDFEDELFFVGATVGDVLIEPYGSLGTYNYGNYTSADDHVIDGDLTLFGSVYPENAGLVVNGDVEVLNNGFNVINRVSAHGLRYRYGDARLPANVTLRDRLEVGHGADYEHACAVITQDPGSTGLALDVDDQPLWQLDLTQTAPVAFAAGSDTMVLNGMSSAGDVSFVSSEPGTSYRLDARGDLRVTGTSFTDAMGVGPGYVATSGTEVNSTRIVAPATCGDGTLDPLEEACDDGNVTAGDGCSAVCTAEPRYTCDGTGCTFVGDVCGDGIVGPSEGCDIGSRCEISGEQCVTADDCSRGGDLCLPYDDFLCTGCVIGGNGGAECFGCPSVCYDPSQAG